MGTRFKKAPRGETGSVEVEIAGVGLVTLNWKSDAHGIWINYTGAKTSGLAGFDVEGERDDEGAIQYRLLQRGGNKFRAQSLSEFPFAGRVKRMPRVLRVARKKAFVFVHKCLVKSSVFK